MVWPPNSPDLNPIDNVWRLLKHRVGRRFPTTDETVRQIAREKWDNLQPSHFQKYIDTMEERVQAVIDAGVGHTKW
jgi:transposase